MFHKVIINNTDTTDSQYDREVLIKLDGNIVIEKHTPVINTTGMVNREFCEVIINTEIYQILGSLDELMDKFNNEVSKSLLEPDYDVEGPDVEIITEG